jgi:excisionase family DNA binding protein
MLALMENWLTTKEAAEKLGLTHVRVNQLIKDGILPAEKRGRDYLIKESDLAKAEARNTKKTGRPPKVKG